MLDFQQTKSAAMQKFWLISPKEIFEEKNVVQNKSAFVFLKFWAKNVGKLPKKNLAASSKLHMKIPGIYFSSHFLMFGDPFCQFATFSRDILKGLSKLFSLSADDRFERRKVLSNREVFFWRISELEQESSWISQKNTGKIAKRLID